MSDVEIIEFKTPGPATLLYLTQIETEEGVEEGEVRSCLLEHFSQWGLLYKLNMGLSDDPSPQFYCYLRYYSVRAAARAKIDNRGCVTLMEGRVRLKLGRAGRGDRESRHLPLARVKCEELANYYLGYNGWSSAVLYHRSEDTGDPAIITYVTVVRLEFPSSGLDCEGAGRCEAARSGDKMEDFRVTAELAKRSKGEAVLAAWDKVVLVVVAGARVSVEINTTKRDHFFYDPTWDEPEVEANEAEYFGEVQ